MIKYYCPVTVIYIQGDIIFLFATVMKRCIIKSLLFLSKFDFSSVAIFKKDNVCCGVKVYFEVK